jgi:hypothetical protein
MERFLKSLIATTVQLILFGFGVICWTSKVNLYFTILGYTIIVVVALITLKVNYEYFESPFYKSLKYPWE